LFNTYSCFSYLAFMNTTVFRQFADIDTKEIAPGFFSKLIHTANNTINFIEVAAGNSVPDHAHIHEQLSFVLEGKFQLTVNGEVQILDDGMFAVIPSNVRHSGLAITDCKLIDVFSPVREDYRDL
jgi:quercetin dioxygenase-like cupin family protein